MKERCKDLIGREVRLVRDIKTKGGCEFLAGTVLTCYGTYRGLFHLIDQEWTPPNTTAWTRPSIRMVRRRDFTLIEESYSLTSTTSP